MKLPQFPIKSGALLVVGFALGLLLAPSLRMTGAADASPFQGKSAAANPQASHTTDAPANSPSRTRARDREPAKKPDVPRISVPVETMVTLLRDGTFRSVNFSELENYIARALKALGVSETETADIKTLIKKSKDEVIAAEKTQFILGRVTPDHIEIDTSGVWDSIHTIVGHLQDGIRATVNPEAAEILISAIDWKHYYPIGGDSLTSLEITRDPSGRFTAWERTSTRGAGYEVDQKFPDDGTPLPADQIFPDRWKPCLKGLTLVPKDGE